MLSFQNAAEPDYVLWNAFVKAASNGNFRQTTYWGEIKSIAGWAPHYFLVKRNDEICGVALIQERKVPLGHTSLLYCPNGPVVDWRDEAACKTLLDGIKSFVKEKKSILVRLDPEPVTDEKDQERILVEAGFKKISDRFSQWNRALYTTRVMLDLDEEKLFMRMRRTHRQNINTAIKNGVVSLYKIKAGDSSSFCVLMQGLEARRQSVLHSNTYHERVFHNLVESGIGYFIKAELGERIISGLIVVILGDKAWAVFMANDYNYRKVMPNKVLLWEAIRLAKSLGCRFIDLGASQGTGDFDPENDPLDLLKSAYRPDVVYYPGYFDFHNSPLYPFFRIAERRLLPELLRYYVNIKKGFHLVLGRRIWKTMRFRLLHRITPDSSEAIYSRSEAVYSYARRGLWPIERYIYSSYLRHPGAILDVACGAGRTAVPLCSYTQCPVIGLDISFNQVREASQAAREAGLNCSFFQGDMSAMGVADQCMDYVSIIFCSLGLLPTREGRESVLNEVSRVLKPNGVAFISVWNHLWPGPWGISWIKWTLLYVLRLLKRNPHASGNRVVWEEGGYLLSHYFWPWEAESLFKKFGLRVVAVIPFSGTWDKNRLVSSTRLTRRFAEGLYFVLTKPDDIASR